MPAVKNVGEPCAGEPHARFDGGGRKPTTVGNAARRQAPPAYPTNLPSRLSRRSTGEHTQPEPLADRGDRWAAEDRDDAIALANDVQARGTVEPFRGV